MIGVHFNEQTPRDLAQTDCSPQIEHGFAKPILHVRQVISGNTQAGYELRPSILCHTALRSLIGVRWTPFFLAAGYDGKHILDGYSPRHMADDFEHCAARRCDIDECRG